MGEDRSADIAANSADQPGTERRFFAVSERKRRAAHDLRSVEHPDIGGRQDDYAHSLPWQRDSLKPAGPGCGRVPFASLAAELRRNWTVSHQQLHGLFAHPVPLQELLRSR